MTPLSAQWKCGWNNGKSWVRSSGGIIDGAADGVTLGVADSATDRAALRVTEGPAIHTANDKELEPPTDSRG